MQSEVKAAVDFSFIRYSVVWEDIDLLYRALRIGPDDDVLSITSAGCNVLGLLLHQPRSLIAIDLNPTQNALLELKMAGIRQLDHDDFLAFIGIRPAANRTNWNATSAPGKRNIWPPFIRRKKLITFCNWTTLPLNKLSLKRSGLLRHLKKALNTISGIITCRRAVIRCCSATCR
jgi:hypothetical protein